MLSLTRNVSSSIIYYLIISKVIENKKSKNINIINQLKIEQLKAIFVIAFIDAFVVGGIVFFSTMIGSVAGIGYNNLVENIKLALLSSIFTAGLTFFNELKTQLKKSKT